MFQNERHQVINIQNDLQEAAAVLRQARINRRRRLGVENEREAVVNEANNQQNRQLNVMKMYSKKLNLYDL